MSPQSDVARSEFNHTVEEYYDRTVTLYEELWGEHVHHGYWDPGASPGAGADRHAASERTVYELAAFARVPAGAYILDAGCGIAGPALHLAREYGCRIDGITLSSAQVVRGEERVRAAGLAGRIHRRQLDAVNTDYPDDTFDMVWALESPEPMPDRKAFLAEALRVLRPGGTLAVSAWCIRDSELSAEDDKILRRIYHHQAIPSLVLLEEYERLCWSVGFSDVQVVEWSDAGRNTWDTEFTLVQDLGRDRSFAMALARSKGVGVLGFFYAIPLMKKAYDRGLMRYGAFRGTKPPPH